MDTGAEVNVVGELLKPTGVKKLAVRIRGVGGALIEAAETGVVRAWLPDGKEISVEGMVLPNSQELLLGMPFLHETDARLWLKGGWIRLGGSWYQTGTPSVRCAQDDKARELVKQHTEHTNFDEENLKKLREIMMEYVDLWEGDRIGQTSVLEHEINTTTTRPVACGPRRYNEEQKKIMAEEVTMMLEQGVIRPSNSPYSSAVVLVRKKTGEWRFCIDFRPLNRTTIRDNHPLPRIDDLLRSVKTSKYFIALDLRAGYWQIRMRKGDINKTAFRTATGLYEFVVMPFGLVNAPATFQRLMELLLGDLHWIGVLVYLDDILIHGESQERVLELLKEVLARLRKANLRLRLKKCSFGPSQVEYLGFVVGGGELKPIPRKTLALQALLPPTNITELRRILGMFGYYRMFIPNYATVGLPLTRLLQKDAVFKWGEEQKAAIKIWKEELTQHTLKVDLSGDLVIDTDASDQAIGAILSVKRADGTEAPAEFASKTLTEVEQR